MTAVPEPDDAERHRRRVRAAIRKALVDHVPCAAIDALLPADDDAESPGYHAATSVRELAERYPSLLANDARKRSGAWFTPDALTEPTADRVLAPLLRERDPRTRRIVDPAVGGGAFLLAALRTLRAHGLTGQQAVACLHGVDLDPTAAALAALVLWEAVGDDALDPCTIAANVRAGDGLCDLPDGAFDAVLTNPPWETLQSHAAARTYARSVRARFRHQGRGKPFTYRLFVERAHQLLRDGGRCGLVVPASLWFDRDAEPLRRLLLDRCAWEWLFGFENRARVFTIDGRYRFGVVIATKGGRTEAVQCAFGRTDLQQWAADSPPHVRYRRDELRALSPNSGAFVEVDERMDLDVAMHMAAHGASLLEPGRGLLWRQGDFNMTADRAAFVERAQAERDGFAQAGDGVWRRDGAADLLPLYQGAMVHDLHPNAAWHAGGTGHGTTWRAPDDPLRLRPLYLVDAEAWRAGASTRSPWRLVHRALSNASNERTALVCLLPDAPCGNSLGVLTPATRGPLRPLAALAAVLSSLPFDWALRVRLGGTNLNAFVLADCLVPHLADGVERELADLALALCAILPWHAELWTAAASEGFGALQKALDAERRAALATRIDLLVGQAFGLTRDHVAWITRGCDVPGDQLARRARSLPTKGFWRIDRDLPRAQRRPLRWLAALQR